MDLADDLLRLTHAVGFAGSRRRVGVTFGHLWYRFVKSFVCLYDRGLGHLRVLVSRACVQMSFNYC